MNVSHRNREGRVSSKESLIAKPISIKCVVRINGTLKKADPMAIIETGSHGMANNNGMLIIGMALFFFRYFGKSLPFKKGKISPKKNVPRP